MHEFPHSLRGTVSERLLARAPVFPGASRVYAVLGTLLRARPRVMIGSRTIELDGGYSTHVAAFMGHVIERDVAALTRGVVTPGSRVFDIGANAGLVTAWLSELVGAHGVVIAVEANPATWKRLDALTIDAKISNVIALHRAVSSESGHAVSMRNPRGIFGNDTGGYLVRTADRPDARTITVDELVRLFGLPQLIKIDVEGHEDGVLAGARGTMVRVDAPAIILETGDYGRRYGSTPADPFRRLMDAGYDTLVSLDPSEAVVSRELSEQSARQVAGGNMLVLKGLSRYPGLTRSFADPVA